MRAIARISAFLLSLALAQPLLAQTQSAKISGLVELSGTGTTSGTNFNDGVKLAVKEINAAGGILGRKIEYTASDTQSQPQVEYPGILIDVSFDKSGDLDRESFMTKVVNGKQEVIATLPPLSAGK
jgi:hypothetical protein